MAKSRGYTPKLPVQQLAILAVARFAEPLALTSVFPYLPEMIASFGVEKNDIAKWAGVTGAAFSIAQSCTAVPWGKASDKFGRKPVILVGLMSTMICFLIWGVSTSLWMALTVRALSGATNGNVGIIRTMVAEMVPEKELQPRAFSLMPLVWSIGSVFGPAFGGFFARPAEQYPGLFGNNWFLKKYPFALPNIVACAVFFVSCMTGLLFLKETLESKRNHRDWGLKLGEKLTDTLRPSKRRRREQHRRRSFVDAEAQAPLLSERDMSSSEQLTAQVSPPTNAEIFTKQTCINLLSYTFLAMHSVAYDQVLPVFLNYPRQTPNEHNTSLPFKFSGGFGLGSDRIGSIFTVYGIACGIIQFFVFPPVCTRFGVLNCYRAAALTFPLVYIVTPYTALIQDDRLRYALFMVVMLVKGFVVIIGFPCTTILLTNSASSLRILGTLNGYATSFSGLGRAIGPAVTGSIFSVGVRKGYMIFPWWALAAVALVGALPSWWIVEGDGPSGRTVDSDDEDDHDGPVEFEEDNLLPAAEGTEVLTLEAESADTDGFDGDFRYTDRDSHDTKRGRSSGSDGRKASAAAARRPERLSIPEPDDSELSDCPLLLPDIKGSPKAKKHPPQVKMRRMSATGKEIEGSRAAARRNSNAGAFDASLD